MRVVFHPEFGRDLNSIFDWLSTERPTSIEPLQRQITKAIAAVIVWPRLAPVVLEMENEIRAVTLTRYPYRIFYRVRGDMIEILHIRHAARVPWEGGR
ncbi:MAG: type II toxin-antitoxin system RelE/ParE family toxin [Methyloceanibacter sp.]|uniref:type II toxin-antitoxin system RelE/ParE family toxin n=1 Tax=Methyloceanibacter sp. TaxID=1965321 RepID=UPI003D6D642D